MKERIVEGIRRWVRKGEELLSRISGANSADEKYTAPDASLEAFFIMAQDARILLASLDEGAFDDDLGMALSGSKARVLLGDISLDELLNDLKEETDKRINLKKQLVTLKLEAGTNGHLPPAGTTSHGRKQEHDLPRIPVDGEDVIETQEDDQPPMVPEKSTTRGKIAFEPSISDTTHTEILSNTVKSDDTKAPPTEVPNSPTHKVLEDLMDNKSVPAAISNQIVPLLSTEMSPQSTSIKSVPDQTVGTLPDSEDLASTTMNAHGPPEGLVIENLVCATRSSSSSISVENNTPNAPPSVPTTIDSSSSDSVTPCSSVNLRMTRQSPGICQINDTTQ